MYFSGMDADETSGASGGFFTDLVGTAGKAYQNTLDYKLKLAQQNQQPQQPVIVPVQQGGGTNWLMVGGVVIGSYLLYRMLTKK
jgi:hypothetical protein